MVINCFIMEPQEKKSVILHKFETNVLSSIIHSRSVHRV